MTVQLSPDPVFSARTAAGLPLVGGLLYTYIAGTLTPQATYVDSTQTTQNTNPVVLNFRGEASVWLNTGLTYKLVLTDASGNLIWSQDQIVGGTVLTQQSIGLILYPQTAAEISAGITPTNYYYPSGVLSRYGGDPTGATSSWAAFNSMALVCQKNGLIATVPPGDWLIDMASHTSIVLQYITINGTGANDTYNVNNQGSVINITGTGTSPFMMQAGVTLNGLTFYYPNQITDGVAPVVYAPTIMVSVANGPVNYCTIQGCVVVNAYRFFVDTDTTGGLGHVYIINNAIYGILTCLEIVGNSDFCVIDSNEFSFAAFNVAELETNPSFRYTTRTSGSALKIGSTDGLEISNNLFFGYNIGINFPTNTGSYNGGLVQQTTINSNYFDQTVFGISVSGAGNITLCQITGNLITGYDNVGAQHSLIGNGIKVSTSGGGNEFNTFDGNTFSVSTGDSVNVSGNSPTRNYTFTGNTFTQWGVYQSSGGPYAGINYTGASSSMLVTGNTFSAAGGVAAICTGILGNCAGANVQSNQFISSGAGALGITGTVAFSASNCLLSGNFSINTGSGTWDDNISAVSLIEIGNLWARPTYGTTYGIPLAKWTQVATDALAGTASPPVPIGALYYNTTVGAMKVRLT